MLVKWIPVALKEYYLICLKMTEKNSNKTCQSAMSWMICYNPTLLLSEQMLWQPPEVWLYICIFCVLQYVIIPCHLRRYRQSFIRIKHTVIKSFPITLGYENSFWLNIMMWLLLSISTKQKGWCILLWAFLFFFMYFVLNISFYFHLCVFIEYFYFKDTGIPCQGIPADYFSWKFCKVKRWECNLICY